MAITRLPSNQLVRFRVSVRGYEEMRRTINRIGKNFPIETGQCMKEEMEVDKEISMSRTPVRTGDLQKSHRVEDPEIYRGDIRCILHAGDELSYAVAVHENLEAFHDDGEAKFLEKTLMESAPTLASRVARRFDLRRLVQ
jgi:hypothetical protein